MTALVAIALLAQVDFARDVKPVLESQCVACHMDEAVMKAVTPGKPEASPLYTTLTLSRPNPRAMPPGAALPASQIATIRNWIAEGARRPEGATLGAPKIARAKDDLALAEKLHRRIVAAPEFKAYKNTIPATTVSYEMVPIAAGEFSMGSPESENGRSADEGPRHKVKVDAFWMAAREVTWDEYRLFMFANLSGETPGADANIDAVSRPTRPYVEMSFGMGIEGFPAISMTQHAANKYAQWLSAKTGHFYRLPTEAEWEYACRAGATTAYSFGDDAAKLGEHAWFAGNSDSKYQPVGKKKPNAWGLYDMEGNVMEWTLDEYDAAFYSKSPAVNPWNRQTKPYPHVARGGSWNEQPARCRCAARTASEPAWKMQDPQLPKSIWYLTDAQWLGFRVVRPLKVPTPSEMFRYWSNGVEVE